MSEDSSLTAVVTLVSFVSIFGVFMGFFVMDAPSNVDADVGIARTFSVDMNHHTTLENIWRPEDRGKYSLGDYDYEFTPQESDSKSYPYSFEMTLTFGENDQNKEGYSWWASDKGVREDVLLVWNTPDGEDAYIFIKDISSRDNNQNFVNCEKYDPNTGTVWTSDVSHNLGKITFVLSVGRKPIESSGSGVRNILNSLMSFSVSGLPSWLTGIIMTIFVSVLAVLIWKFAPLPWTNFVGGDMF